MHYWCQAARANHPAGSGQQPLCGFHSRLQGRAAGLLQFRSLRAVHRNRAAGQPGPSRREEDRMGLRQPAREECPGGGPVYSRPLSQRLESLTPPMRTILAVILALGVLASPLPRAQAAPQPNIILILADDMGYGDIASFGSVKNRTPNLDRMAREGVKLTSFYAAPVCTPSRAQILTGCYAKRVSLPLVLSPAAPIGLSAHEHCIAELLKQQGYATIAIGKWHVGDQPEFLPTRHGFDRYFGLPYSNDMGGSGNRAKPRRDTHPPLPLIENDHAIETVTPEGQNQLTARYTDEAVNFIRGHKDTPFLDRKSVV